MGNWYELCHLAECTLRRPMNKQDEVIGMFHHIRKKGIGTPRQAFLVPRSNDEVRIPESKLFTEQFDLKANV